MLCQLSAAHAPAVIALVALGLAMSLASFAGAAPAAKPFNFKEASKNVPKPREVWPHVKKDMVPLEFKVLSDEIVQSDTDPSQKLRKVTAHFWSIELEGKKWGHPCVIFTPADNSRNMTPERRGKVAIVGSPAWRYFPVHVDKYGERQYIRVDRVGYSDGYHPEDCPGGVDLWPTEADGSGQSLTRKVPSAYGNDPDNWMAAAPSPAD